MSVFTRQAITARTWIAAAGALMFSIASAFSYFSFVAQGIAAGALMGLPDRVPDFIVAQNRAGYSRIICALCLGSSMTLTAVALPLDDDASPLSRFLVRLILASIISLTLTALIGILAIITGRQILT